MTVRLPHRHVAELVKRMKRNTTQARRAQFGDIDVVYGVHEGDSETAGMTGCYDESGDIFVLADLVRLDPQFADLVAYHEHLEVIYKRAGNSHARAHRRAIVGELLAAKALMGDAARLHAYVSWRIGAYPVAKVPDPGVVIEQLEQLLLLYPVRKGRLLEAITRHRL